MTGVALENATGSSKTKGSLNKAKLSMKEEILFEIPCFYCSNLNNCGLGGGIDPSKCKKLESWLLSC